MVTVEHPLDARPAPPAWRSWLFRAGRPAPSPAGGPAASAPASPQAAAPLVACAHCGQPCPPGPAPAPPAPPRFCCAGCATVHALIHAAALDGYYAFCERAGTRPSPVAERARAYVELDAPDALLRRGAVEHEGVTHVPLAIDGVHCAACLWLLERLPRLVPGVVSARLNVARGVLHVGFDAAATRLSEIARHLAALGYPPRPEVAGPSPDAPSIRSARTLAIRLAVAGASAGNVMLMAFALYGGQFEAMSPEWRAFFRWGCLVATLPALLHAARPFFAGARQAIAARAPHMDLPISVALAVGFAWGLHNTITGRGEIYFDTLTTVIFLLLVGRWLQARQQRHAGNAPALLEALTPRAARRVRGPSTEDVALGALAAGDAIEVRAGEVVPVDGTVLEGSSCVDLSILTGESRPLAVAPGDQVHAGTLNVRSPLRVQVGAVGARTRLGRIVALVEVIASGRAPIVTLADRLAGRFAALVLVMALVTGAAWWLATGQGTPAIDRAVALLVITCPCALGMATPLAIEVALGKAARRGILIKGGPVVERIAGLDRVVLDKTGTLTTGRLGLVFWSGERATERWVQALEARVNHPIALALAEGLPGGAVATDVVQHLGRGVSGAVEGHEVAVGAPGWIVDGAARLAPEISAALETCARRGWTPLLVRVDGEVRAAIGLGDPIRPEAAAAVAHLRALGASLHVASGDDAAVVGHVGEALGLPADHLHGQATPEAKVALVERLGPCVMVGDGVNDAAALAAAAAGVAVHGGAEASLAAADVFFTRPDLELLPELLAGCRRTLRVIRRNLVFSLLYNAVGATLAAAGVLDPLLAAILMPLSSLTVISSAYRSRTFDTGGGR